MVKRCLALLLVATLLLAAAPAAFAKGGPNVNKAKDLKFSDWADAAWALEHMVMMRAKGIIKGYANGKFKPNSAISQAEALAMVIRMKGEATDQAALAINLTTPVPGIAAASWARGYIAYALQQGWIDSTFQPNAAAKRAWVARLMVKALVDGWQAQVAANAGAVVQFKDANEIKAEDRPFVAIVVARGWMIGYPNGNFQPNKPVTRAEMAALLNRGSAILPLRHPYEVKGVVEAVDAVNHKIRVFTEQQLREFTVWTDALILLENQTVTLADLRQGDKVEMILNPSQIVLVIRAERDEHAGWYPFLTGTVMAFNFAATPRTITLQYLDWYGPQQTTTYTLAEDCKAKYLGYEVPLSTIVIGDKVRLELNSTGRVKMIQITEKAGSTSVGSEIVGTIAEVNVGSSGVSIRIQGYPSFYPIASGASITPSGITPAALVPGWLVRATLTGGYITALQVLNQGTATTVQGMVVGTNLNTTPKAIVLVVPGSGGSTVHIYTLAATCTTAYYLGAPVGLDTIHSGDKATLTLDSAQLVTSIVITERVH